MMTTGAYVATLQREAERVLTEARSALEGLLSVHVPMDRPVKFQRPVVTVSFYHMTKRYAMNSRLGVALKEITTQDRVQPARYSSETESPALATHPDAPMMMDATVNVGYGDHYEYKELHPQVYGWMIEDESFPTIEIELRHPANAKVSKKLVEAIQTFMVRSVTQTLVPISDVPTEFQAYARKPRSRTAFGLKFTQCNLTYACLLLVQNMLETVVAHPNRQFDISVLDLSYNRMSKPQLALLQGILVLAGALAATEVRLNKVLYRMPQEAERGSVWFFATTGWIEAEKSASQGTIAPAAFVRKLSLDHNHVDVECFAAFATALRYGSTLEEFSFAGPMATDFCPIAHEYCWRWVVFGLFYPRSKRFAEAYKLRKIDLSGMRMTNRALGAMEMMLHNLVDLLSEGFDGDEDFVFDRLRAFQICVVKKGAKVHSTNDVDSEVLLVLYDQKEYKSIYK